MLVKCEYNASLAKALFFFNIGFENGVAKLTFLNHEPTSMDYNTCLTYTDSDSAALLAVFYHYLFVLLK